MFLSCLYNLNLDICEEILDSILFGERRVALTQKLFFFFFFFLKNRGNEHFGVELAMMTMSTYHVGVPASSVDYVVYHWRQDRKEVQSQWPEKCYDYSITGKTE